MSSSEHKFEIHIHESPFLKVRKGPIRITCAGHEFATINGGEYRRVGCEPWRVAHVTKTFVEGHYPASTWQYFVDVKALNADGRYEMLSVQEFFDEVRVRIRETNLLKMMKVGEELRIRDEEGELIATYHWGVERPADMPDFEGKVTICSNCSDDQIDALLITFVSWRHGLE